jgi:hypothetical protein
MESFFIWDTEFHFPDVLDHVAKFCDASSLLPAAFIIPDP